jgi:hypothetical protein
MDALGKEMSWGESARYRMTKMVVTEETPLQMDFPDLPVVVMRRWSEKRLEAIRWLTEGYSHEDVGKKTGTLTGTVNGWMSDPWYRYVVQSYRQRRFEDLKPALGTIMVNAAEYMMKVTRGEVDLTDDQNFRRATLSHNTLASSAYRLLRNAARMDEERSARVSRQSEEPGYIEQTG